MNQALSNYCLGFGLLTCPNIFYTLDYSYTSKGHNLRFFKGLKFKV